jgi:hypothetical protein
MQISIATDALPGRQAFLSENSADRIYRYSVEEERDHFFSSPAVYSKSESYGLVSVAKENFVITVIAEANSGPSGNLGDYVSYRLAFDVAKLAMRDLSLSDARQDLGRTSPKFATPLPPPPSPSLIDQGVAVLVGVAGAFAALSGSLLSKTPDPFGGMRFKTSYGHINEALGNVTGTTSVEIDADARRKASARRGFPVIKVGASLGAGIGMGLEVGLQAGPAFGIATGFALFATMLVIPDPSATISRVGLGD